jgi:hypothetical protein
MNVKKIQIVLQKTITWTKKYEKGKQEWEKPCIELGCIKLKTLIKTKFVSKVIIFEKTLEFKHAIITCYGKQMTISL